MNEVKILQDKVAIVTGGSSGLGARIAESLVQFGAKVSVWDITEPSSDARVADWCHVDVSDPESVSDALNHVTSSLGTPEILFANAGIARGKGPVTEEGRLENFSMDDWEQVVDVNLYGVLNCLRTVGAVMRENQVGKIIVTASTAGLRADPLVSYAYVAAKSAVVGISKQAAIDLAPHGVTVNLIAPGPFRTNLAGERGNSEDVWANTVPLGRVGDPREIRGLVRLLASDDSSFITGAVHAIDGGALLQ